MNNYLIFFALLIIYQKSHGLPERAHIDISRASGSISINTWKYYRDRNIVKQNLDHSCAAASVATILNYYYGISTTEEEILASMNKENRMASFYDIAEVLPKYGFFGVGYAISFDQLINIKIPVIVHTRNRGIEHFSVLKGIDKDVIMIADPSLGNRTYSKAEFLKIWGYENDGISKGRILSILPKNKKQKTYWE